MSTNSLSQAAAKGKRPSSTPIYSGTRIIGEVRGEVFHKTIIGSKHLLKQPPAIATDDDALEQAERAGARWMEVRDSESKTTYRASLELLHSSGFPVKRHFGAQTGLTLNLWSRKKQGDSEQPGLFDDNRREK